MSLSPSPTYPQTEWLQIGDNRLSTSCGVVDRPDSHYGYDHVELFSSLQKRSRHKITPRYDDKYGSKGNRIVEQQKMT